ncbi:hypothetical protein AB0K00_50390 [Dactylosporangium sp. NPDC049525]
MTADERDGPLRDAESVKLKRLLARYAELALDQFEHWRVDS